MFKSKSFNKIIHFVLKEYRAYNVKIDVEAYRYNPDSGVLGLKVCYKPPTRKRDILDLAEDIRTMLQLELTPYEENGQMYISIPIEDRKNVKLLDMLKRFDSNNMMLPLLLGKDIRNGSYYSIDLDEEVHMLYAGGTNTGKSVGEQCAITSLIALHKPNDLNIVIIDAGGSSLDIFERIPHLSHPIVKDVETSVRVTNKLLEELERRISLGEVELTQLPSIVVIIDEFVSLMTKSSYNKQLHKRLSDNISMLLQRGRKGKIHLILATQDITKKSLDIDIGNVKARIAFKTTTYQESIAILGCTGAEKLSGRGAMLYKSSSGTELVPIQGAYISDNEVKAIVERIKSEDYDLSNKFVIPEADLTEERVMDFLDDGVIDDSSNEELAKIVMWVLSLNEVSAANVKKRWSMGNRANTIMDNMFIMGIVSDKNGNKPRKVLPSTFEDISLETRALLAKYGYTEELISEVVGKRTASS